MDECPYCEKKFKRLEDFPLICIAKFERLEIPEIIGSSFSQIHPERKSKEVGNEPLPKEVLKLFQESGKDVISYQGIVYRKLPPEVYSSEGMPYYESSGDITAIVKGAIETPEVQKTLNALESAVGREWRTADLLALPGFNRFKVGDYRDLSLSFGEYPSEHSDARISRVNLNGGWDGGSLSCAYISQDLATLHYEGRINPHST